MEAGDGHGVSHASQCRRRSLEEGIRFLQRGHDRLQGLLCALQLCGACRIARGHSSVKLSCHHRLQPQESRPCYRGLQNRSTFASASASARLTCPKWLQHRASRPRRSDSPVTISLGFSLFQSSQTDFRRSVTRANALSLSNWCQDRRAHSLGTTVEGMASFCSATLRAFCSDCSDF